MGATTFKKKKIKLLYLFLAIIACIILFVVWLFIRPCPEPKKPENVPVSAVWIGGRDGGNWIELVYIKYDAIRLRFYNDWDGHLILDAKFVPEKHEDFPPLTVANWNKYVIGYNGIELLCQKQLDCSDCPWIGLVPLSVYYKER